MIDERSRLHHLQSLSFAGKLGIFATSILYVYSLLGRGEQRLDLLLILLLMVFGKLLAFSYFQRVR
jgi:hypothetical protein